MKEHDAAMAIRQKLVVEILDSAEDRYLLGSTYMNRGNVFGDMHKYTDTEASHRQGMATFEKLVAEFPSVPEYRRSLGSSHMNISSLFAAMGRPADAESESRSGDYRTGKTRNRLP